MLCALAVACGVAEPAVLERVPITPEFLAGRWETVYSSLDVTSDSSTLFAKDGTFVVEQVNRRTGKAKPLEHRLYTIDGRRIMTENPTAESEQLRFGTCAITLLAGNRMRMQALQRGKSYGILQKVSDR